MEQQTAVVRQRRIPPPTLGPVLIAARARAGYGVRQCARLAGISHPYLLRLESGERVPSRMVAELLADVLALEPDERAVLMAASVADVGRSHPQRSRRVVPA